MQKLKPTLWRTCRVLANESRLNLLRLLFSCAESTVSALAEEMDISASLASIHLRALNARGLISARPAGRWMFYSANPNLAVEHAGSIVGAVREHCTAGAENESLIRMATAFTHPRRISIARCLCAGEKSYLELLVSIRISQAALYRHLEKLSARSMVEMENERYRLADPEDPLGRTLLTIATA